MAIRPKMKQPTKESLNPSWHVVDASGKTLGRISSEIAILLQGKHKPEYVPYMNVGDYVVVINASKIKDLDFIDSWRKQNPEEGSIYSWFDYRSRMFDDSPKRGLRIDHILVSQNLEASIIDTGIDYDARAMEKPSDALVRRGISYIEVRALDINPFDPNGIDQQQMDFLDVYLVTCLLMPSEELTLETIATARDNMNKVVLEGRDPELTLSHQGNEVTMLHWAAELFDKFEQVAAIFDNAYDTQNYTTAVAVERAKLADPAKTPSGQIMDMLLKDDADNSALGLLLAKEYAQAYAKLDYTHQNENDFQELAKSSLQAQKKIEDADEEDFETFIRNYFNEPPAKKNA